MSPSEVVCDDILDGLVRLRAHGGPAVLRHSDGRILARMDDSGDRSEDHVHPVTGRLRCGDRHGTAR